MYWLVQHQVEKGMDKHIFVLVLSNNTHFNLIVISVTTLSTDEWLRLRNL